MNIDWNNAPDWADEVGKNNYQELAWLGAPGYSYFTGNGGVVGWDAELAFDRSAFNIIDTRPIVWNGEGLPPVGEVCEVLNAELSNPEWEQATILYLGKHRIMYDSASCNERVGFIEDLKFRQIRTPEQIAAEERLSSAYAMCDIAPSLCNGDAIALYDAGFRRRLEQ